MKDENLEDQVLKAKDYLKESPGLHSQKNLYDNISELINNVLTEQPKDSVDLIERYLSKGSIQKENGVDGNTLQVQVAETQIKLFEKQIDEDVVENAENEEEFEIPLPNCTELSFFFEQAGIGLSREEMYRIFLALKQLVFSYPLTNVRFWGKILGIERNYIVAEAEFREGEGEEDENGEFKKIKQRNENLTLSKTKKNISCKRCHKCGLRKRTNTDEEEDVVEEKVEENNEDEEGPQEEDDFPKPTWKPPPVIPKEDPRSGVNKKVYFVCNRAGEQWVKLPHVTPQEITLARKIMKLFTGRLDAEVTSYPPFPGKEINLLRAQITRISASTQISPAGFYMFDEEEEDDEEEGHETYMENTEFEGLSLHELTDSSMNYWVHHTQHVLPQGRCSWFNPFERPEDDFEEDDLDEDEMENESTIPPETGPQLLSSVQLDKNDDDIPSWSTYASSRVLPEYAVAVARSNTWPGAYAFAKGRIFENIYIGWGKKYSRTCYAPPVPPSAFEEFPDGPEIQEVDDPSVEEEKLLKERQEEAMKAAEDMENLDDDDEDD